MTENVSSIFTGIRKQADSISSISEEHSAGIEEILSTTIEQNLSIENIYDLIQSINNLSGKLQDLVRQR